MRIIELLKRRVMKLSRGKKLEHFYCMCRSDSTILDVGVSNYTFDKSVNMLLNNFNLSDDQYTGLAVEDMYELKKRHPTKNFVEYNGKVFPFKDKSFDWIFCNAVIEHVGGEYEQIDFINEMVRVGKNVFFTTPNRFFPVESHTNVIFLHWLPSKIFYSWCRRYRPAWTERNLVLLSETNLRNILDKSLTTSYKIQKNRLLFMSMTFTVLCTG